MKKLIVISLLFAATVLARQEEKPVLMNNCPLNIQGLKVVASDTGTGFAVLFTTTASNIDELRRRVDRMAQIYKAPLDRSTLLSDDKLIPVTAKYQPVHNGALLTLMPKDPAQLDEFRIQSPEHAEMMRNAACSTK